MVVSQKVKYYLYKIKHLLNLGYCFHKSLEFGENFNLNTSEETVGFNKLICTFLTVTSSVVLSITDNPLKNLHSK